MSCPCCSGQPYSDCCQPYHEGKRLPDPLPLMRSRYSAYALGHSDYIIATTHPQSPYLEKDPVQWKRTIDEFCQKTQFVRLEIHDSGANWVHFTAHLKQGGKEVLLREKSYFQQHEGKWLYLRGV